MAKAHNEKKRAIWNAKKAFVRAKRAKLGQSSATTKAENEIVRREAVEKSLEEIGSGLGALLTGKAELPVDVKFIEQALYGSVDGVTAVFSQNCRGGIFTTIGSAFAVVDNMAFVIPAKAMKFGISLNNLTEGMNVIFAMCDFTDLINGLTKYIKYEQWDQYVILGTRIGGFMISDFEKKKECIEEGMAGDMGYDVGLCAGQSVSAILDSVL